MRFRLVVTCVAVFAATAWAAESPSKMEARRLAEQARTYRAYTKSPFNLPVVDGPQDRTARWMATEAADRTDRSIIQDDYSLHTGLSVMNPIEPGIQLASTTYDFQHNDAATHQIATNGSGKYVHFAWTHSDMIPVSLSQVVRYVNISDYNSAGAGSWPMGMGGATVSDGDGGDAKQAGGGFVTLDVDDQDRAHYGFHARDVINQPSGDYSSWELDQALAGFAVWTTNKMLYSEGQIGYDDDDKIWPHVTVDQIAGGSDYIHVVSHPRGPRYYDLGFYDWLVYWRKPGAGLWQGPFVVDSTQFLSYNVACDRTSDRCALIATGAYKYAPGLPGLPNGNPLGINQVWYRESATNGDDWGPVNTTGLGNSNRTFITNYQDAKGPGAWVEAVGDYDNAGELHVVWNEQRFNAGVYQGSWKHWAPSVFTSTIHQAYYDNKGMVGARDINIAYPTIGFGDGSTTCGAGTNLNYIYMTFVQFGGPSAAQQNDMSAKWYMNGDIYLSVSNNGGAQWSPAVNLTNSMKPGCDPALTDSCPSENWPSIARTIDDTIHIEYIADRDAGDAVLGQGSFTYNPVMYYRIPGGTDVQPVCPLLAPNFGAELSDPNAGQCEYNTLPGGSLPLTLTLSNMGNAPLYYSITPPPSGSFILIPGAGPVWSIPAGGVAPYPVTLDATGLVPGLYQGQIRIWQTDPTKPSGYVIPVRLRVGPYGFYKMSVAHTKWLELEVSNVARVARDPNPGIGGAVTAGSDGMPLPPLPSPGRAGMYRPPYALSGNPAGPDSGNNSIYDGSLIIARPPVDVNQPPDGVLDTVVYRSVFGLGNYAEGFQALSDLTVDTSAYGTGGGKAWVSAHQTTVDSIIGIDVKYEFPQDNDSSDFVLIKYRIFNRTTNTYTGLIFGEAVDFDVVPATRYANRQNGSENKAGMKMSMNLLYQQGVDWAEVSLNQAEKYLGGMAAIQNSVSPRAWIAPNDPWLFNSPGGGFHEGYLYSQLMKNGFEIIAPVPEPTDGGVDMHSVIAFDKNVTLTPTTVKHYVLGFVSSTAGPAATDLENTTKKAWKFAFGWDDVISLDSVPASTPKSYPYYAIGSHEDGPTSGCCGCVITEVYDPDSLFSIVPDADACTGTISFAGAPSGTHTATFRLSTKPCAGVTYTEDHVITIVQLCSCPHQGDIDASGFIDVSDVLRVIGIAFVNGTDVQDPQCPKSRGDVNNSGAVDVNDVLYIIKTAFLNGPAPVDPCL